MRQVFITGLISIIFCSCGQKNDNKSAFGTSQYTGQYDLGGDIEKGRIGSVTVYSETDNTILFFLNVNRGAPSYNMGQLYGRISIENNKGSFNEKILDYYNGCKLRFEFKEEILTIEYINEQDRDCGFGFAVWASGDYRRQNKLQPEFFQDQMGDTVYFAKTTPEKYNEE